MADLHLAVVDLNDLQSADPARRADATRVLGEALETWGFVAITGHGVPTELLDDCYAAAREFFALPDEVKARYEHPETGRQRGYTGFGIEHAKGTGVADLKEFWQLGRALTPETAAAGMPANIAPDAHPTFGARTEALFEAVDTFASVLLAAILAHLGATDAGLLDAVRAGNSVLRVIHYPPVGAEAPEGAVRSAAHEDINLLTVLPASTEPGLELLDKSTGTWRALQTPPGVMICDTGDIMQRMTGGRLRSTTHRVVNPPGARNVPRFSMPFFCHPRPDWPIGVQDDGTTLTAGAFLRQRLVENGVLPPS
jgi:isopenicillin N synthase-like dioxygenase